LAAHKRAEEMRSQISLLEETLAKEQEKKVEKEDELNTMKRLSLLTRCSHFV